MPILSEDQIKALNEWSRTQPALRAKFAYTNLQGTERSNPGAGNIGLGDYIASQLTTVRETDGTPELNPDTLSFNSAEFYLTQGTDPNEVIVNFRGSTGGGTGDVTDGVSLGGDVDVFEGKSGTILQFRGLSAGTGIELTENANDIDIAIDTDVVALKSDIGPGFYGIVVKDDDTVVVTDSIRFFGGDFDVDLDGSDALVTLNPIVNAEAFYLNSGGSFFNIATNQAVLEGDTNLVIRANPIVSPSGSARSIFIQSPINIVSPAVVNANFPDTPTSGKMIVAEGTVDATGNSNIGYGLVDQQASVEIDTAQAFAFVNVFTGNIKLREEGTGSAHGGFFHSGFHSSPQLLIASNAAVRSWISPSHHSGYVAEPTVKRATGFTGSVTLAEVIGFQTNPDLGTDATRNFLSLNQFSTGVTVTEYSHFKAGSADSGALTMAGGTITTEYGLRLQNIGRGATPISVWSNSTTATLRHAGSVSIGKTTAPTVPLDVVGDAIVSDQLRVGSTAAPTAGINLDVVGDAIVSDQLRVGSTAAPTAGIELDVTGESQFSGQLRAANGSMGAPSYSFTNDTDCGIYRVGTDQVGLAVNSSLKMSVSDQTISYDNLSSGVTYNCSLRIVDSTAQLLVPAGTSSLPSMSFDNAFASGIYGIIHSGTSADIGISVDTSEVAVFGRDGLRVNDKVEAEAFYFEDGGDFFSEPSTVAVGGQVGFMPPRLTSTERDALTAQNGMIVFNVTTGKLQGRESAAWVDLV